MLHQKTVKLLLFFIAVVFFAACDSSRVFEENKVIENQLWNNKNKMVFYVNVDDTITPHNFYINVRNATDYPFSNLFLFMETRYPQGTYSKDTLECVLADNTGKWLGDGSGDIWDNQILFRKNFKFKRKGKHVFSLEQAMRLENLPQILDIGIRIEKSIK
jgi:gliding motility-associated lipoprotein GldH